MAQRAEFNLPAEEAEATRKYTIGRSVTAEGRYVRLEKFGCLTLTVAPYYGPTDLLVEWEVPDGKLPATYFLVIAQAVQEIAVYGIEGQGPLVHLRITVVDGQHNELNSCNSAYMYATSLALKAAVAEAGLVEVPRELPEAAL